MSASIAENNNIFFINLLQPIAMWNNRNQTELINPDFPTSIFLDTYKNFKLKFKNLNHKYRSNKYIRFIDATDFLTNEYIDSDGFHLKASGNK